LKLSQGIASQALDLRVLGERWRLAVNAGAALGGAGADGSNTASPIRAPLKAMNRGPPRTCSREDLLLDCPGVRERSIGRQSLDDNTVERRGIPGCVDSRDLRIKVQGESAALLEDQASPTAVAVEPDQARTLRPKRIDDGQTVDRKAPVEVT
jgi:hypothetical protein